MLYLFLSFPHNAIFCFEDLKNFINYINKCKQNRLSQKNLKSISIKCKSPGLKKNFPAKIPLGYQHCTLFTGGKYNIFQHDNTIRAAIVPVVIGMIK